MDPSYVFASFVLAFAVLCAIIHKLMVDNILKTVGRPPLSWLPWRNQNQTARPTRREQGSYFFQKLVLKDFPRDCPSVNWQIRVSPIQPDAHLNITVKGDTI